MKIKAKQIVAAAVAASMCVVPITPPTDVWADEVIPYTNTHESAFKGLSEQNQLIAQEAKRQILEIAEGRRSDAILQIKLTDLGIDVTDPQYDVTLSELGLKASDFDENGIAVNWNPSVAWQKWAENKGYFGYYNNGDWKKINHALWEECAATLFWHDKASDGTAGITVWPVSVVLKEDGKVGITADSYIPLAMTVRKKYAAAATYNTIYDTYHSGTGHSTNVDTAAAAAESNTLIANALAVVNQFADLPDREKLTAYRDYILDAVTYDNASASLVGQYAEPTDAFFAGNVFDNDPSTNVVCEGYAKAFKLLCDLSTFQDPTVDVKLVTGKLTSQVIATASGDHMWNVVTLGGENYIVDLTNSDGEKSSYDKLFMVGAKDYYGDYRVETNAGNFTFSYKESDGNNYNDSYLPADLVITSNVMKKENSWTTPLTVENITEGDTAAPAAAAAYGEVSYLYSSAADGEYTADVPSAAGTWWVKAVVAEGADYKGLESEPVSFQIAERVQNQNSWTEELTASDSTYGEKFFRKQSELGQTKKQF